MMPGPHQFLGYLLLFILSKASADSVTKLVSCGNHQIDVGQMFTIKGSSQLCSWTFQAPENGIVEATCRRFSVPRSRYCKQSFLQVTSSTSRKIRYCGRKSRMTINRSSQSVTFTNKPQSKKSTQFTCDVYVKMSTRVSADCSCGIENTPVTKIIGGISTSPGQYPWIGGITFYGMKKHFCSLTLLTADHALTAAHCIYGKKRSKLTAVLAEHDIKDRKDTPRITRKIRRISYHPQHNPKRVNFGDLAVVTFDYPVPMDHSLIRPVCLPPDDNQSYAGKDALVAGWGIVDPNPENYSNKLKAATVPVWKNKDCRKTGFGKLIHDDLLCAGFPEGGADACLGDSGSPLTVQHGSSHKLIGVVSFGYRCGLENWPGVYSRVSGSIDWIKTEINQGTKCQDP